MKHSSGYYGSDSSMRTGICLPMKPPVCKTVISDAAGYCPVCCKKLTTTKIEMEEEKMKKLLSLLLTLAMILSLAACGGGDDEKTPSSDDKTSSSTQQQQQEDKTPEADPNEGEDEPDNSGGEETPDPGTSGSAEGSHELFDIEQLAGVSEFPDFAKKAIGTLSWCDDLSRSMPQYEIYYNAYMKNVTQEDFEIYIANLNANAPKDPVEGEEFVYYWDWGQIILNSKHDLVTTQ